MAVILLSQLHGMARGVDGDGVSYAGRGHSIKTGAVHFDRQLSKKSQKVGTV